MNYQKLVNHFMNYNHTNDIYNSLRNGIEKDLIKKKKKYYSWIPCSPYKIIEIIQDLEKSNIIFEEKSFMDIGCGKPDIPEIFDILGCKKSKGLEYQELYCILDRKNYLIQGDLLKYNFKEYDILFSYNPIMDYLLMQKGIVNIIKTMKKGAIFYFVPACGTGIPLFEKFTNIKNSDILKFIK